MSFSCARRATAPRAALSFTRLFYAAAFLAAFSTLTPAPVKAALPAVFAETAPALTYHAGQKAAKPGAETTVKISGVKWPGVVDCLLQRPLPDAPVSSATVHINYPSLGYKNVDADIRTWVTEIADAFESHLNPLSPDSLSAEAELDSQINAFLRDDDVYAPLADNEPQNVELYGAYDISRPSGNAVSVTFELWNYAGAANGNLDVITLNYNLRNGQRLNFVDIFEKPEIALALLSKLTREKIAAKFGETALTRATIAGTEPTIENFSSITLTPRGLRVNFQPYQIGPANGAPQKFHVDLSELAPAEPLLSLWEK